MDDAATHETHMKRALALARTALEARELPVAAVLASGHEVLAEAHNRVAGERDLLAHAEFRVLLEAKGFLQNLKLLERQQLALYVTPETVVRRRIRNSRPTSERSAVLSGEEARTISLALVT